MGFEKENEHRVGPIISKGAEPLFILVKRMMIGVGNSFLND
jgi:hypothetical protein